MKVSVISRFVLLLMSISVPEAAIHRGGSERNGGQCQSGYYGYNCRHHCHCTDRSECDVMKPHCQKGCVDGWSGPTCQSQNILFGLPSKIRSRDPSVRSRLAVDGDRSTCVTSDPDDPGWLRVDLQQMRTVYHLRLITDNITSARSWQIFVTEYSDFYWVTPCATVRSNSRDVVMTCDSPSRGRYVTVFNIHGPVTVCELQANVCADYTFGAQCDKVCQCADASDVCHPLTGFCVTGCRPGVTGRHCQTPCNMTYGPNCVTACGHCSHGAACHPVSGICPRNCRPGWTGPYCNTTCPAGQYGQDCDQKCGACLDGHTCDPLTGHCPSLCQPGHQGPRCDQGCERGKYGASCQFRCGHCLSGSTCNADTGMCPVGCDTGWEGLFCSQECLPRNYGPNCHHECHHCLTSCDSHTGICDVNGCSAGKRGRLCDQDCRRGSYGANCSRTCGRCKDRDVGCDVITGHCPRGQCVAGWNGPLCDTMCRTRMYGENCSQQCGSCEGSDVCDPVTGICPAGCVDGFHGDMCQTLAIFVNTTSKTSIALIASILTITLLVLFVVCVCLALKWRRDHHIVPKPVLL